MLCRTVEEEADFVQSTQVNTSARSEEALGCIQEYQIEENSAKKSLVAKTWIEILKEQKEVVDIYEDDEAVCRACLCSTTRFCDKPSHFVHFTVDVAQL